MLLKTSPLYYDYGYSIDQTEDDGYIITGVANYYNSDGESGILLIKTDPEGNTVPYGD